MSLRKHCLDEVFHAERSRGNESFPRMKSAGGAGDEGGAADAVEDMLLGRRKLAGVAADGGDFGFEGFGDVHREVAEKPAEALWLEGEAEIEVSGDVVH